MFFGGKKCATLIDETHCCSYLVMTSKYGGARFRMGPERPLQWTRNAVKIGVSGLLGF